MENGLQHYFPKMFLGMQQCFSVWMHMLWVMVISGLKYERACGVHQNICVHRLTLTVLVTTIDALGHFETG